MLTAKQVTARRPTYDNQASMFNHLSEPELIAELERLRWRLAELEQQAAAHQSGAQALCASENTYRVLVDGAS